MQVVRTMSTVKMDPPKYQMVDEYDPDAARQPPIAPVVLHTESEKTPVVIAPTPASAFPAHWLRIKDA